MISINIKYIIEKSKDKIMELNNNYNLNKIDTNFYYFKVNIYKYFLKIFIENKIDCKLLRINNEYYIFEDFLKLLHLNHPNKNDIILILSNIFPNITNIINKIFNDDEYKYKTVLYNNEIVNIIHINELLFNDDFLLKMFDLNTINNEFISEYIYNCDKIKQDYYKYILNHINFTIVDLVKNEFNDQKKILNIIENLTNKINLLINENINIINSINKIENKIVKNNNEIHLDDLEYFKI